MSMAKCCDPKQSMQTADNLEGINQIPDDTTFVLYH